MAITRASDLVIPLEVFAETVPAVLAGMPALYGTEAAIVRNNLPGDVRGGATVSVPYFDALADFEDAPSDENLSNDVNNLSVPTIQKVTMTKEQATVQHSYIAVEASYFSQMVSLPDGDPIVEAARQVRNKVQRLADKKLIAEGETTTLVRDIYDAGTPASLTWEEIEEGKNLFGDEMDDITGIAMHSDVLTQLKKQKDSQGRPLVYEPTGDGRLQRIGGLPVIVSNRLTKESDPLGNTTSPNRYKTLLLKRSGLVFWMNGTPDILTDTDILQNSNLIAMHLYYAVHLYKRTPNSTTPGVAAILHNL